MLQQNKIHPRLAFTACGLFCDAENAYQTSMDYYEEQAKKAMEKASQEPVKEEGSNESKDND
jgi:hypothetical protein